ncbi:MAG: serine protease [Kofleriaceae bacterium]|nr:serine protease [Kofleriaceae bacterium]
MLRSLALVLLLSSPALAGNLASPVVGGTTVKRGAYPDVVGVFTADGGMCTGTLLAADLVLTAGHCASAQPIEVVVDSIDLAEPDGQHRKVKWSKAYPKWLDSYDVGIVMLENPVSAKKRAVAQGCTDKQLAAGTKLKLVGFGLTTKSGQGDNTRLHQATLPVDDPTCSADPSCQESIAPGGEFTAGGNGVDACFGDSGGPVYIKTPAGLALIGVVSRGLVSWGDPCGEGGVFVRADKVVKWIEAESGRKLDRAACDGPADDAGDGDAMETGGCSTGGGMLESGFAVIFGLALLLGMRRR